MFSVHCVHVCESKRVRKKPVDQRALRLSRVLHRWIDHWTRLLVNVLMPCAIENQRAIVTVSWQQTLVTVYTARVSRAEGVKTLAGSLVQ